MLSRAGYTFLGWSETDGDTGELSADAAYTVTKSGTVYAIWSMDAPTLSLDSSGIEREYAAGSSDTVTVTPSHTLKSGITYTYLWRKANNTEPASSTASLTVRNCADSGAYSCAVTVSDGTYSSTAYTEINISIAPLLLTKPSVSGTYTYNGAEQTAAITASTYYGLSGNKAVSAGTHTVTVSLTDKDNTMWEDESTDDLSLDFAIGKAGLTVTAEDAGILRGDAVPSFTATYTGFAGSDSESALTGPLAFSCIYTVTSAAGTYVINPYGYSSDNYDISYKPGTLTVSIKSVTKPTVADGYSVVYNADVQRISVAAGDDYTVTGDTASFAGTYTVKAALKNKVGTEWAGGGTDDISVQWQITPAALTVTADSVGISYLDDKPQFTSKVTGFAGTDDETAISGSLSYECSYKAGDAPGEYTFTPSGYSADNYTFKYTSGTLTVSRITVPKPQYTAPALVYNGSAQYPGISSSVFYTLGGMLYATDAGEYGVIISLPDETGYVWGDGTTAPYSESWTIARAPMTVSAPRFFLTVGDIAPEITVSVTGYVGNDDSSVFTGSPAVSCDYTPQSPVGIYTISLSGYTAANYAVTVINGSISVSPVYTEISEPSGGLSFTYSGEEILFIEDSETYTVTGAGGTDAGSYTAFVTPAAGYAWQGGSQDSVALVFEIIPAALTVKADNAAAVYGGAAPAYTYTASGFAGNDGLSVLTGTAVFSSGYSEGSPAGTYEVAVSGLSAKNYTVAFESGTLTVSRLSVQLPSAPAPLTYNASMQSPVFGGENMVPGGDTSARDAGTYTAVISLRVPDSMEWSDGTTADRSISWTIARAAASVRAADVTAVYGAQETELRYEVAGFFAGDEPVITLERAAGAAVGAYPVTVTVTGAGNYNVTITNGVYTVTRAVYDMTGIAFSDDEFIYDGEPHSVGITGVLPEGVTVSYTGNGAAEAGVYPVYAVFTGDAENYEPIPDMMAVLVIKSAEGTDDSAAVKAIIDSIRAIDVSHLAPDALELYNKRLESFIEAASSAGAEEAQRLADSFKEALETFVISLSAEELTSSSVQYYEGETAYGANIGIEYFYLDSAVEVGAFETVYANGDRFTAGDTYYTVRFCGLEKKITVPAVLPASAGRYTFDIQNSRGTYVYGNAMPEISGKAYGADGSEADGTFAWSEAAGAAGLSAGAGSYGFVFTPADGTDAVYGSCILYVRQAPCSITNVRVSSQDVLVYGDALPALVCESSVPGTVCFAGGQKLLSGTASYTYIFTPDNGNYTQKTGSIELTAGRRPLTVKAKDVLVYEGDAPSFVLVYTGLAEGDTPVSLTAVPAVAGVPSAVGTYTVAPSGGSSDNYIFTYEESELIIKSSAYRMTVTVNSDEGSGTFTLENGSVLHVKLLTDFAPLTGEGSFADFVDNGLLLSPTESLRYVYSFELVNKDGSKNTDKRIIELMIPQELRQDVIFHIIDCTDGFSVITDIEKDGESVAFTADGDGIFAISAAGAYAAADYVNTATQSGSNPEDAETDGILKSRFVRMKCVYNDLCGAGFSALITEQAKDRIKEELSSIIIFSNNGAGGIAASGLWNVSTPQLTQEGVTRVEITLSGTAHTPTSGQSEAAKALGLTALSTLDLNLYVTTVTVQDGATVSRTETVPNSAINGGINVLVPLTTELAAANNLTLLFQKPDGENEQYHCTNIISGNAEFTYSTVPHLSEYIIAGEPAKGVNDEYNSTAWLILLCASAAALTAAGAAYTLFIIRRRRRDNG